MVFGYDRVDCSLTYATDAQSGGSEPGIYDYNDYVNASKYGIPTPVPYVINFSSEIVYFKPEGNGRAISLYPNQLYVYRIDGVNSIPVGVYKVPDLGSIRVNPDRSIQ